MSDLREERVEELLAAYRKWYVDDYVSRCSPSPGVSVEWFEERGREAMEQFEKKATGCAT